MEVVLRAERMRGDVAERDDKRCDGCFEKGPTDVSMMTERDVTVRRTNGNDRTRRNPVDLCMRFVRRRSAVRPVGQTPMLETRRLARK